MHFNIYKKPDKCHSNIGGVSWGVVCRQVVLPPTKTGCVWIYIEHHISDTTKWHIPMTICQLRIKTSRRCIAVLLPSVL
jgi:hypothetical protein